MLDYQGESGAVNRKAQYSVNMVKISLVLKSSVPCVTKQLGKITRTVLEATGGQVSTASVFNIMSSLQPV